MSQLILNLSNVDALTKKQDSKKCAILVSSPGNIEIIFKLLQKMIAVYMQFFLIEV